MPLNIEIRKSERELNLKHVIGKMGALSNLSDTGICS
jgi:hypothetical protein